MRSLLFLALALLSTFRPATAQELTGQLQSELIDGGATLEVTFQLKASTPFNLGLSSFQFTFNTDALTFPASPTEGPASDFELLAFHADANANYASSVTRANASKVSVNIFHFTGSGDALGTAFVDVAKVRFAVTDTSQTANLAFTVCQAARDDFTEVQGTCTAFSGDDTALPVELTTFEAVQDGDVYRLQWTTASETSNAGFHIEHANRPTSLSAFSAFTSIAFVDGAGTTLEAQHYTFPLTLSTLQPGTHRFRLRQVDFDGAAAYSPTVEVGIEVPRQLQLHAAYPNPFNPQTTLGFTVPRSGQASLTVYDLLGRPVATLFDGPAEAGRAYRLVFDAANLASGTYLYRLRFGQEVRSRRLVLLK